MARQRAMCSRLIVAPTVASTGPAAQRDAASSWVTATSASQAEPRLEPVMAAGLVHACHAMYELLKF